MAATVLKTIITYHSKRNKGMTYHSKPNARHASDETNEEHQAQDEQHLQPDMQVLCDAFRLDERTRIALTEYDACTIEDFSFMTHQDFEGMLITAVRKHRPLSPLQQRKVAVMLLWIHSLVQDSEVFKAKPVKGEIPSFWERLLHPNSEHQKLNPAQVFPSKMEANVEPPADQSIIPSNWESRLRTDMPVLKKMLREMGETSSCSMLTASIMTFRWIYCGYDG